MLQHIHDRLLLRRLAPRWVGSEVHVDVYGRRFMIGDLPGGVTVRTLATSNPVMFDDPDDALTVMGLGLDATRQRTLE